MPKEAQLDWANIDPAHIFEWMEVICAEDGTITFMYGGYGKWYKVSWKTPTRQGSVTAETPERLVARANAAILGICG